MPGWVLPGSRKLERGLPMSSEIAIKVQDLCKRYQIYDKPHHRLLQMFARGRRQYFREFWALRNVNLEVRKGETLAIIGRNGSGKSTLLQLICSTLNPSSGGITVNGKVAALLELGAGFNPEFTGRENVYMAASLYGLSKGEVDGRFDSIEAFADIGQFIEQPVKTYSSGMYVRLAFAVIAHVDADILVVDEALAVGDAVFTQKCMRFIRGFQKKGTLLFVSHDTGAVQNLCERAVWLSDGVVQKIGSSKEVSEDYLRHSLQTIYGSQATLASLEKDVASVREPTPGRRLDADWDADAVSYEATCDVLNNLSDANGWTTGGAEILSVELVGVDTSDSAVLKGGELLRMTIRAQAHSDLARPILGFLLKDRLGQDLFGENTLPFTDHNPRSVKAGQEFDGVFVFRLPMLPNGQYSVMASVADGDLHNNVQHHWLHDALILSVASSKVRWGLVGVQFSRVELGIV